MVKLMAFDLDGTLTQHKTHLTEEARTALNALRRKYRLLMVGAGTAQRIFDQMEQYPVEIIGNYGMQYSRCVNGQLETVYDFTVPCNRDSVLQRMNILRRMYGMTEYCGDSVEFHPSGCVTLPLLGTKAAQPDKLAYDPDRKKRRAIYDEVRTLFPEYNVFVGGSSSFDMAPSPYNKAYALQKFCDENGYSRTETVYVGDDYGLGGNDECVLQVGFPFVKVDDYRTFPALISRYL